MLSFIKIIFFLVFATFAYGAPTEKYKSICSFGQLPGNWSLNKSNHRDKFIPDNGWGNGNLFVTHIKSKKALAFSFENETFFSCDQVKETIIKIGSKQNFTEQAGIKYKCNQKIPDTAFPPIVFFDQDFLPDNSEFFSWEESMDSKSPKWFQTEEKNLTYIEKKSQSKLLNGTIHLSAWVSGYPPLKKYDENYGEEVIIKMPEVKYFSIHIQRKGTEEIFLNTMKDPEKNKKLSGEFISSFLPSSISFDRSEMKGIYQFKNKVWFRVDSNQNIEGSGVDESIDITSFQNTTWTNEANCSRTRMY